MGDELKEEQTNNYMQQMKKMYSVDTGVLNDMDWLLLMAGSIGTVLCTVAFFYWFYKIIMFIHQVNRGKARFRDLKFWKRIGIGLIMIILFMSGSLVMLFARFFDFMAVWGWRGN